MKDGKYGNGDHNSSEQHEAAAAIAITVFHSSRRNEVPRKKCDVWAAPAGLLRVCVENGHRRPGAPSYDSADPDESHAEKEKSPRAGLHLFGEALDVHGISSLRKEAPG